MATELKIEAAKTYVTRENAIKAAQKLYGHNDALRFVVIQLEDGRYTPVFIGQSAVGAGVHFNFSVVG